MLLSFSQIAFLKTEQRDIRRVVYLVMCNYSRIQARSLRHVFDTRTTYKTQILYISRQMYNMTHCLMMMTSHLFSRLIMPLLVAAATAGKILLVFFMALPMLVCTLPHRVKMMTTARQTPSKLSLAIRVSSRTRAALMMGWMSV